MIVRMAGSKDENSWDAFVEGHPDATPYHLFAWKKAVEQGYGHRCSYLIAESRQGIVGVLPLVRMGILGRFGRLVSLPFCDRAGVLAESPEITEELARSALSLARAHGAGSIELRSLRKNAPWPEHCPLPVATRSSKVDMTLDLPSSSSDLWSGFRSKLRSQVRRALKNGLEFSLTGPEGFESFYAVYGRNMKRLGSPAHSRRWMLAILRSYGERARVGVVYHSHKSVAAGIVLCIGRRVCVPWASTLAECNSLAPGMLLYWRLLEYAADQGFEQFGFGRSTPGEGSYKFKAQWGARPVPLYWHKMRLSGKDRGPEEMEPHRRQLAERVWRKMPLEVANWLGPLVRKHISL